MSGRCRREALAGERRTGRHRRKRGRFFFCLTFSTCFIQQPQHSDALFMSRALPVGQKSPWREQRPSQLTSRTTVTNSSTAQGSMYLDCSRACIAITLGDMCGFLLLLSKHRIYKFPGDIGQNISLFIRDGPRFSNVNYPSHKHGDTLRSKWVLKLRGCFACLQRDGPSLCTCCVHNHTNSLFLALATMEDLVSCQLPTLSYQGQCLCTDYRKSQNPKIPSHRGRSD